MLKKNLTFIVSLISAVCVTVLSMGFLIFSYNNIISFVDSFSNDRINNTIMDKMFISQYKPNPPIKKSYYSDVSSKGCGANPSTYYLSSKKSEDKITDYNNYKDQAIIKEFGRLRVENNKFSPSVANNLKEYRWILNSMNYLDALMYEEEENCFVYSGRIFIEKQMILGICGNTNCPYYPILLKFLVIIFNFETLLFFNCLLFSQKYVSQRFKAVGSLGIGYIFSSEIVRPILSVLFTIIITRLINYFLLDRYAFYCIVKDTYERIRIIVRSQENNYIKYHQKLRIKMAIVLLLMIGLCFIYWDFSSMFSNIYSNSEKAMFLTVLTSIIINLIFDIFIYFVFGLLKFLGLKNKNK